MRTLIDNEHLVVEEHAAERVIVTRRTASRPDAPGALERAYAEALELSERYQGWGLVIDTRMAPGRNDPRFEAAIERLRIAADRAFSRVAMVVATAVGELQARRMEAEGRQQGSYLTRDLADAIRFASGADD